MKQFNSENGFTLVEILASIFIIILMSGIIFSNYRQSGHQFALQRSANKLAQDIRRAQQMAMEAEGFCSVPPCPPNSLTFPPGYGIYVSTGNTNYLLYADTNPVGGDENYGGDTVIETINLENGVYIHSANPASFSINFKPPDPTTNIGGGAVNEGIITLALQADTSKTKTIKVNEAGLIEIE